MKIMFVNSFINISVKCNNCGLEFSVPKNTRVIVCPSCNAIYERWEKSKMDNSWGYNKVIKYSAIFGAVVGGIVSLISISLIGLDPDYPIEQIAAIVGAMIGMAFGFIFWGVILYAIYRCFKKIVNKVKNKENK